MNLLKNMTTDPPAKLPNDKENRPRRRALSWVFALIWAVAITFIAKMRDDIPTYMLLIATLFFFMLVPSMNDLVRDYEKFMARIRGKASPSNSE